MSIFSSVELGLPVEVFALNKAYNEDTNTSKANLGVGAYRTSAGKPYVLPVVREAEIKIASDPNINHEYLPVCGSDHFTTAATKLLLGESSPAIVNKRAFGVQTLSGTGALRLGCEFLCRKLSKKVIYYSDPTWENHHKLAEAAGFETIRTYRYWNKKTRSIDMEGFLADLNEAPEGAVIILHACAHNPTGCDPTPEQWKQIADVIAAKNLFPFFDSAYQGFASGDPDKDAAAVRYFVCRNFEMLIAQSFAKNFGLYCERVGNLTVVQGSAETTAAVHSQFTLLVRAMYSNPPAFGSRIVSTILNDAELRERWLESIQKMSKRISDMRQALYDHLIQLGTPGNWDHIITQIGMFSYTGLTEKQCKLLIDDFHVYLLKSGRISMCGINENNVEYIAKSIHYCVQKVDSQL